MWYVLTFGGDPLTLETLAGSERDRAQAAFDAWWVHCRRAGRVVTGVWLRAPFTATTIRFSSGHPVVYDGPCTPDREAIGGYGIITAAILDEALALAVSWPAGGYIEIRPLRVPFRLAEMRGDWRETPPGGHHRCDLPW
jgi:hypothetical protein